MDMAFRISDMKLFSHEAVAMRRERGRRDFVQLVREHLEWVERGGRTSEGRRAMLQRALVAPREVANELADRHMRTYGDPEEGSRSAITQAAINWVY